MVPKGALRVPEAHQRIGKGIEKALLIELGINNQRVIEALGKINVYALCEMTDIS